MIQFEKCQICNITTNQFITHRCRKCIKTGVVCKSCVAAGGSKRHLADNGNLRMGGTTTQYTWSTGCCVDCDKAEIRDKKLEELGI